MIDFEDVRKYSYCGDVVYLERIAASAIASGCDLNDIDMKTGQTLLMYAAECDGATDAVRALIKAGADVNIHDKEGRTALHLSACFHSRAIRPLCRAGADINARDEDGRTPLMLAVGYPANGGAECLLDAGADAFLRDSSGKSASDICRESHVYNSPAAKDSMLKIIADAGARQLEKERMDAENTQRPGADYEL